MIRVILKNYDFYFIMIFIIREKKKNGKCRNLKTAEWTRTTKNGMNFFSHIYFQTHLVILPDLRKKTTRLTWSVNGLIVNALSSCHYVIFLFLCCCRQLFACRYEQYIRFDDANDTSHLHGTQLDVFSVGCYWIAFRKCSFWLAKWSMAEKTKTLGETPHYYSLPEFTVP